MQRHGAPVAIESMAAAPRLHYLVCEIMSNVRRTAGELVGLAEACPRLTPDGKHDFGLQNHAHGFHVKEKRFRVAHPLTLSAHGRIRRRAHGFFDARAVL